MFGFLRVSQSIVQDLCCADDYVIVLHNFPEKVLLLTLSTDRHQGVVMAQVWFELFGVVLVHKVNLQCKKTLKTKYHV